MTRHILLCYLAGKETCKDMLNLVKDWKTVRDQSLKLADEGIIWVYGEFCQELEEIVLEALQIVKRSGKREAIVLINSNGGKNMVCLTIRNAMALSGIKFTGIVIGKAYSNGFVLLQACHKRCAMPNSQLMFHWGSTTLRNSELAAIIAGDMWPLENIKRDELKEAELVSQKTGITVEQLARLALYERDFYAEEALKINFIDEIVTELPTKTVLPEV